MSAPMTMIDNIPDPNEAQLNWRSAFESLDWSIMRLLFACRCWVFWAAAGRGFDPPPPMMRQTKQKRQRKKGWPAGHWVSTGHWLSAELQEEDDPQHQDEAH